ncbi:GntR family transcriptional regulator [Amycolatopsis sp. K13G38]|uniref:GntR family transcriptional regulator n=1 Tax=Amycolatopsis acididurans TaxID=2724524 RepID=A0ABX1JDY5_9PSEU|nr:GntR family transcriptional regulator [Amycolatopsis acididurans]NKQ57664.1 GntR family transcriptional regulator [Amycolatopsis acididurans]
MTSTRKRSGGPLYRQVESELLRRIRAGELSPGQRLPTEGELATEWGINRLTIRHAIGELARAGHVTVRQGSGTYVAEPQMVVELDLPRVPSTDADAGSTATIAEYTRQDQTETLVTITDSDTDARAAQALEVPTPLVRVGTLVRMGGRPFLVCSYWLESGRVPLLATHIGERVALFQALHDHFGIHLRHSWRSLTATLATREDAELLDLSPGSPIMLRDGVNVDDHNVPTMYLRRRIRADPTTHPAHSRPKSARCAAADLRELQSGVHEDPSMDGDEHGPFRC